MIFFSHSVESSPDIRNRIYLYFCYHHAGIRIFEDIANSKVKFFCFARLNVQDVAVAYWLDGCDKLMLNELSTALS